MFNPRVSDGWFRYLVGTEVREVNVLQLAAANGQISAKDPTMMKMLGMIDAATKTTGTRAAQTDPLYDNYVWQSPSELFEHQPTVRIDYNLTDRHRINGSFSTITAKRTPDYLNNTDPRFPGAPNKRDFVSKRPLISLAMRSVLTTNIVNELRGGLTAFASGSNFGYSSDIASSNDPSSFADTGGFAITTPTNTTNWFTSNAPSWRKAPTYSIEDNLTWNHRSHTITTGGNLMISNASSSGQQVVRGITVGFNTDFDPAIGLFNTTNFPGASTDQLSAARGTYAWLTGRVSSITSQAVLNGATGKYEELAPSTLEGGYKVFGMFAQDTWRVKPNLTLTGGLRYDIQTPFKPFTSVMSSVTMASICGRSGVGDGGVYSRCNFLTPGSLGGVSPNFILLEEGSEGYDTDLNNVAPSGSIAWRPNVQSGFMRKILGDPDQATLRAGYSIAFDRQGLTRFTTLYGDNRGASISLTRNANTGLVPAGESWPVLLSQTSRLSAATFNTDPSYPIAAGANRADNLNAFAPDIKIGRVQSWTIGFARSISKDMAVEIRYVGNRGSNLWRSYNINETNIIENGFLQEFRNAQRNLEISLAQPTPVSSFANRGLPGQVALPIFDTAFGPRGTVAAVAATAGYQNGTFVTQLQQGQAGRLANTLAGDFRYLCPMVGSALAGCTSRGYNAAAPYPINFFQANPYGAGQNMRQLTDEASSKYDSLQLQFRKRYTRGISMTANYTYAKSRTDRYVVGADSQQNYRTLRDKALDWGPTAYDLRHTFQTYWTYDLPFGKDRAVSIDNGLLNQVFGGWSASGIVRVQTGRPFLLTSGRQTLNQEDAGVVLNGITAEDLQKAVSVRPGPNGNVFFFDERFIGADGRANSSLLAVPTTPGSQGQYIYLNGPGLWTADLSVAKNFNVPGGQRINFEALFINAFNHRNVLVGATGGATLSIDSTTFGQTTTAALNARQVQFRLGFYF